ncbi:DUF4382 domain-containing protein [Echinicola vietnamensis]|uniref:DUF4382 domain-containing protein n=1 Tax=Echinicola vietnamensis (strain DSM 17526 / LMG 23754 / KMM 6221) TaxID=926556 RepID=L0FY85_ECHVK|nr:DUF4382 domain-containing protein [Echinicola vietnamensis]AGA77721.1 hypothetical protein Echvi_1455 [Echinicola vietnamensis DSM 17526]
MRNFHIKTCLLGLAGLAVMASCNSDDEESMEGAATVNVSLVDAPADYDEVWIEVLGVELLPGDEPEEGDGWVYIPYDEEDAHINLLSLVNGNEAFIGSEEISAGSISKLRLILGEDNFLVMDGEEIPLTTPSAQQSGLKLQLDQELMAGIQYDLVIDFDAAKSIVQAGNSGQYILKPVLRVIAEESASIEGQVLPIEAHPVVYGVINEDTVSTFADETGSFALRGLVEGNYTVIFDPSEEYEADTLLNVPAVDGEITVLDPVELEMAADLEVDIEAGN